MFHYPKFHDPTLSGCDVISLNGGHANIIGTELQRRNVGTASNIMTCRLIQNFTETRPLDQKSFQGGQTHVITMI
jgi:hypothetical protein